MSDRGFIVTITGLMVVSILAGVGVEIREQSWTDGYCSALEGQRIARYTCEVDGRVIRP